MTTSLIEQVPLPGRSRVTGNRGAVTAMTSGAARAGGEILVAGGNAADAAVAAGLAAGVVEPAMNGLGGTAYCVVFRPGNSQVVVLDGSARCPARAHEEMFEPLTGVGGGLYGFPPTKGDHAETGPLSVLVPTAPATLFELHRRFGRLPFAAVVEPAIRLAEEGFVPDWVFAVHAAAGYRRLRLSPAALDLYTRGDGIPFVPGGEEDRLRNPDLAGSLRVLAGEGPEPFYRGPIAHRLLETVNDAGGILSECDFEATAVREVPPLQFSFRDFAVATLPANSGGPTLAAALSHLGAFPPAGPPSGSTEQEVRFLHLAGESLRLAFLDRLRYLGDPESAFVPLPGLLSPGYLHDRRRGLAPDAPRIVTPEEPLPPGTEAASGAPPSGAPTTDCTTHVNVMDHEGMAVALTATLGGRFGSAFAVPGLGYPLNNGMMWFDPRPGRRISPAPGRRALHAAAPAILFRDGVPWAVVGSPGGRRLISAVLMGVARLVDRGMNIQDAVGGPGFHADEGPLTLDERTPNIRALARGLKERGHQVMIRRETALSGHFGRASGVRRTPTARGMRFEPGVDPVRAGTGVAVKHAGESEDGQTL